MISDVSYALSLSAPWPSSIEQHDKRVENRERWVNTPSNVSKARSLIGHDLAIQTSGTYDLGGAAMIYHLTGHNYPRPSVANKAITSVVRLTGLLMPGDRPPPGQERWYFGGIALTFDRVRVLPKPVPFKGGFGFLLIPDETLDAVLKQLQKARSV
ncbi:hypothetical protein Dxin01_02746 [Deinococcus xinjiangensis]|uniref:Uncharacterized protein n=1 Tax=Deinococcus xinjiangensis TaxID=457454 RepID=A0ABP9VCN8_9DEIO